MCQDDQPEKDRWMFSEQVERFFCDTLGQQHGRILPIGLSSQFKQQFSTWVACRIEHRAKARDHFPKSWNRLASLEQTRHRSSHIVRIVRFPQEGFDPFYLPSMLDSLESR